MHTEYLTRTEPEPEPEPEPTPDRTRATPASTNTTPLEDPRTATDRAPRMFSTQNRARLENLVDEWNAAFAPGRTDEAA